MSEETKPQEVGLRIDLQTVNTYLDTLAAADPEAFAKLLDIKVPCNVKIVEHPTAKVVYDANNTPHLGILGVLNAVIGAAKDEWNYTTTPTAPVVAVDEVQVVESRINAEAVVAALNSLVEADRECLTKMIDMRVPCNTTLLDHPTAQVVCDGAVNGEVINPRIGLLGVVNGLLGITEQGWGYIAAEMDEEGNFHRYVQNPKLVPLTG